MSADGFPSELFVPTHQRAKGELSLSVRRRGDATVIEDLRQMGCLKARFPRREHGAWAGAVTLNTSGGIAGGDALSSRIFIGDSGRLTVAAQAAERFYRALPDAAPAHVRTRFSVGAGSSGEWLPQETILFDGCAMDRALDVDVAPDGWFLGVESLVFGRRAMGEQVRTARVRDVIRVRRGGRLVLNDAIRLQGLISGRLEHPAVGNGARAVATLVHVAPEAGDRLEALREALGAFEAGASAWDGVLVGRIVASDGAALRAAVIAGLTALREGRPLPRVWQC